MKQLCYFVIILITLTQYSDCSISNLNLLEKSLTHTNLESKHGAGRAKSFSSLINKKKKTKKLKKKLPKHAFLWEGWLKFIRLTDKPSPMRPSNFFVNPQYHYQKVFKSQIKKKDGKGYLNIRDKFEFFGVMKTDGLYIFKSRKIAFDKMVEEIKIIDIKKINEKKKFLSSVREIENFQGGYCMRVKTKYPITPTLNYNEKSKGHTQDYIICLDKKKELDKLINYFVQLKLAQQKHLKKMLKKKPAKSLADLKKKLKPNSNISRPKGWVPKDGYWILLQDWTSCSLKCGGGKSYQQWMCVPPKKGGKKCVGQPIRTKPCNTKPCPGNKALKNEYTKSGPPNKVLKPIIKSMPFSERPQNFLKCVIKENDVFYLKENKNKKGKKLKIPSRIVMNTHSISVFTDDNYKNSVFSFDLKKTEITPKKKEKCCFDLQNGREEFTICGGFGQPCGPSSNPKFVNGWVKDFNLFKIGCYENLKIKNWKQEQTKKAMKDAMDAAGLGGLNDRANLIKKNIKKKQADEWSKKLQNTQSAAMKAMKREFDIEKMLQQELQLKAELEAKKLLALKKREEKKKECLEKALKDRDSQNKRLMDNKHKQSELNAIKENAKKEVQNQRNKLREKLNNIRKKFKRRKRLIEQDINVIRAQMAKNLMNAHKKGDMMVCKKAYGNKNLIETYCNRNIVEDYTKNIECRSDSSFCYVCCENEFGNLVMEKRDICYKMCDQLLKNSMNTGDFLWT